jgi:hypothetical protein
MTHIALQKGIDDCIDCPGPMGTPSITTGLMENDKNPDIIPVQKRGKNRHPVTKNNKNMDN